MKTFVNVNTWLAPTHEIWANKIVAKSHITISMFCKSCLERHYTHLPRYYRMQSSPPADIRNITRLFAREKAILQESLAQFLHGTQFDLGQCCNNSLSKQEKHWYEVYIFCQTKTSVQCTLHYRSSQIFFVVFCVSQQGPECYWVCVNLGKYWTNW